jgi:hypothetical protein
VNILRGALDYQSSLGSFEALQLAPAPGQSDVVGLRGTNVVALPAVSPRGVFRAGTTSAF